MTADTQSISAIINKALQPKGISARVAQKADTLQIFLQSAQPINKEAVTTFLTNRVKKLNVKGISKLAVYAKQTGETAVSWATQADIAAVPSKTSCQESPVETAEPAKKQSDFSASKTSTQKAPVPTAKPAKKQSVSPWLGAGTLITLIISLPTIVLFLIPIAIALSAQTFSYSKGERDKTKLGELSCKYFIGSFWGLFALAGVSSMLFPDLRKPVTVATTTPSPVAAPEDKAKAISSNDEKQTKSKCRIAAGHMWTGVRVYLDSNCEKPFATILGGTKVDGEKGVVLKFDSGETEVKLRSAVRDDAYVMEDDPAVERQQWQEF